MIDQISKYPALENIFSSLQSVFKDSIIEGRFEKEELSVKVKKESILLILKFLRDEKGFNALSDMIGLDNSSVNKEGQKRFSVLYQLYRFPGFERIRIVIDVDENDPVDSAYPVYKSADWAEREIFDMFGINFSGHPNLRRIYMPDNFDGYPLRKDFPLEGRQ
ncbi:MAG: NADH-quinone oxidoreductase subunit C [Spirochaetes bacterium]|nr:NADH-quinone oxidoreductase subunit C [Spirochaetota bacterium]